MGGVILGDIAKQVFSEGLDDLLYRVAVRARCACPRCGAASTGSSTVSQDSLPPVLSQLFTCENGHDWSIAWEGP